MFSQDWSGPFRQNAARNLQHLRTQPIRYVEIGVFEGRSLLWMAENILLHPDSVAIGFDPFIGEGADSRETARQNLAGNPKIILVESAFNACQADVIYIDGGHDYLNVMRDTIIAWDSLKPSGIIAWDDTDWDEPEYQVIDVVSPFLQHVPHERLPAENQIWVSKT